MKSRLNYTRLPEIPVLNGTPPTDLVVIIPARNEEKNIGRTVSSFPGVPVIVVDDASTDRTSELAQAAGAHVIPAPALMPGMKGKPNACLAGAAATHSRWLLFVDADTWYEPQFLVSLLAFALKRELVAASVFIHQERESLFEKLLLPYAFALYFCGVNARRVNDPGSREALANGQCLLFRRDAYEFINGHRAVANSVIEDVALARILKRHRMASAVLRAEHLGHVRMYDSFAAIWRGFQKNSFRFLLVNPLSGLQVVLASIFLTSYLPTLVWLMLQHNFAVAVAFAFGPTLILFPWYRSLAALFAPAAIYIFQLIVLNAMASTLIGRKAVWKGRHV